MTQRPLANVAAHGFSLVECLVALLIFALGISGALAMQLQAQRQATEAILAMRALALSEELLARSSVHNELRYAWQQGYATGHQPAPPGGGDAALTLPALDDWMLRLGAQPAGTAGQGGVGSTPALPAARLCASAQGELLDVVLGWEAPLAAADGPTLLGAGAADLPANCSGAEHSRVRLRAYLGAGM